MNLKLSLLVFPLIMLGTSPMARAEGVYLSPTGVTPITDYPPTTYPVSPKPTSDGPTIASPEYVFAHMPPLSPVAPPPPPSFWLWLFSIAEESGSSAYKATTSPISLKPGSPNYPISKGDGGFTGLYEAELENYKAWWELYGQYYDPNGGFKRPVPLKDFDPTYPE